MAIPPGEPAGVEQFYAKRSDAAGTDIRPFLSNVARSGVRRVAPATVLDEPFPK